MKKHKNRVLTAQRRQFALAWLRTSNATKAAIEAGYSQKTADRQGSFLLKSVEVQRFLAGRFSKLELEADRLFGEVARQAFEEIPDIGELFDEHDNLRPLHELTIEQRRWIASVEVVKKNLAAGDGKVDTVHKIKMWNIRAERTKAQELLARLLKLMTNSESSAPQVSIFAIATLPALSPPASMTIEHDRRTPGH